jgi:hypothetical protein
MPLLALVSGLSEHVYLQVTQLRLIFEQAEAKKQEREWLRNQQQGHPLRACSLF